LQLGILIETMRREGYELSSSPRVLLKLMNEVNVWSLWKKVIDVDEPYPAPSSATCRNARLR